MPRSRFTRRAALAGAAGLSLASAAATTRAMRLGEESPEQRYPPLGRLVSVEGMDVHLIETGPPDAPPVVLIHGASGNVRDFTFSFVDQLTDRFRVIALDRPGFGHSERGPGGRPAPDIHRPDVQARVLRAATDQLGVRRPIVVGHSWGGAAALAWGLDAPENTRGVVSLCGVSHPWPGSAGWIYDLGASFAASVVTFAFRALVTERSAIDRLDAIFRPQRAPQGYGDYVGVGLALRPATFQANAVDIAELKAVILRQRARYPGLEVPVEAVHGAVDEIVPARIHSERLAAESPMTNLTLLPGVGHMPHHVAPEACVAAIERVLDRADA